VQAADMLAHEQLDGIWALKGEMKPPCEAAEALEDLRVARAYLCLRKGV
jgi:hypothetical protein